MARWQQYALFAAWLLLLASTPLWASSVHAPRFIGDDGLKMRIMW